MFVVSDGKMMSHSFEAGITVEPQSMLSTCEFYCTFILTPQQPE